MTSSRDVVHPRTAAAKPPQLTAAAASDQPLLHELFEQQAQRSPDAVAVAFEEASLTYQELDDRAQRLAELLRRKGAGPDVLVALYMERSLELVVSLYAVLKAGSAYVPVDPEYPTDRTTFILADAGAPIVLTQSHLVAALPDGEATVMVVDQLDLQGGVSSSLRRAAVSSCRPHHLAYVIYTSGSTGRPKGVMITHRAICNRLLWMQDEYRVTSEDRVLQKTPFSFDVSVWEFFWPLLSGAALVLARPGGHRDNAYLLDLVRRERITTMHFVPSMLKLFLATPDVELCSGLRRVICSGEALPRALQDRFFDKLDVDLYNLYGPTEATVDVTHWHCDRSSGLSFVPIGRPVANTQIHLLDDAGQPVATGETGRLFIGGVQVARGYLNRPELTAERFVPDPFAADPRARMYDTGDLARRLPDGVIQFLGRKDHQVKLRGFRVELGEIEAVLQTHPGVGEAVVTAGEDFAGDVRLVAYYVGQAGSAPTPDDLRRHLAATLPGYMVPADMVELKSLPLTPSGKVDRKLLPSPERAAFDPSTHTAATDKVERYVADVWRELLGVASVGPGDRFFELGGTSLQAARFANRLQRDLGEPVFIVSLFSAPTAAEYAAFLRAQYPEPLSRLLGMSEARRSVDGRLGSVTAETLSRFAALVPRLVGVPPETPSPRNPTAVFLLSPPRSGTTLLRVMLAGHPELFAASELQLLGFHTLSEREAAYTGRFSLWLDGTIRALMELVPTGPDEARALMSQLADDGLTTREFYRRLQDLARPRTLVDKSPSYALDAGALARAEADFELPLYIHLVRHPAAMIDSFEKHHMDQALCLRDHDFTPRELAELVWTVSHQVISDFLAGIPVDRWHRLRFEDLVIDPRAELAKLCTVLGLPFHEGLLHPYDDLAGKMTDGVFEESRPMGDTRFLDYGRIVPEAAHSWKRKGIAVPLGEPTLELAARLGYPASEASDQTRRSSLRDQSLAARRDRRRRISRGSNG